MKLEQSEIQRYEDLAGQIGEIDQTAAQVAPFVVGALGTISMKRSATRCTLGITDIIGSVQVVPLLGTVHMLRKVLSLCG